MDGAVYVILRMYGGSPDSPEIEMIHRVGIKKVVWTQEIAEREVDRLNEVNGHKGYVYFWHYARLQKPVTPNEAEIGISQDIEEYYGK
jgi:hypothetical protein